VYEKNILRFHSDIEGLLDVQILNDVGQLLKHSRVNIVKGKNEFRISVPDIKPGMYILKFNDG